MTHDVSQNVGVGILGAGRPNVATSNHIPACLRSRKVALVALCDRLGGVRDYARQCGATAYTDYAAMLADPRVQMVQIATPDWLHCEHAEQALAAGKHVLLQKPPGISPAELKRLRQAAAAAPGRLKVALNNRQTRTCRTFRKLIDEGAVGRVRNVRIVYRGKRFPVADPDSPYLKNALGGVWIHNGLHWLDEAFVYCGVRPVAVQAFTARNPEGAAMVLGEGPNYWCACFEMGPDITFHFEYNTMLTGDGLPGGMLRWVIGDEGEIRQEFGSSEIALFRQGAPGPEKVPVAAPRPSAADDAVESFRRVIDTFADEIIRDREASPTLDESLSLMRALFAGAESARKRQRIVLETAQ
ncbi:MAG: Gfo/Idh/MocA family oxidoreductase [Kiritimatiellaeota bacterium]|nr:Gfo/Idh/MocA family oxidoreductase [Kiritimatiellota bacterium]